MQENQQKIGLNFDAYQMFENELVIVIPNDNQQWCEELTSALNITSTINCMTRKQGFFYWEIGQKVSQMVVWFDEGAILDKSFSTQPLWLGFLAGFFA